MEILALLLVTSWCSCFLASPLFFRPEMNNIVVPPGIYDTLYHVYPEVPVLPDWLALYPYQRYHTTKHRLKRQTNWGVQASLSIPLWGGSSEPKWSVGGFLAHSNPHFNARVDAGLGGIFGRSPDFTFNGQINGSG
ncbi:hypothetical protein ACJMK2_032547 [Sinanodonta woodiana]|uniref:Uncharacterized protein n=1 Tax=Sinanodonta woodiana TaxID=1069815 RepID=A0ABD3X229_SINWO